MASNPRKQDANVDKEEGNTKTKTKIKMAKMNFLTKTLMKMMKTSSKFILLMNK
jgi:hypothetical protein